ncbi:PREDICTED: helicase SRCAP-like [Dinoponera quadriceps]|uniref:Helicase SRCAP-like n=1 Tax=Dinoponera quadriceps TaxID=609295 RepID=A0A6P3WND7_DINQU|nr:PREDICTED: helicase SRCAP-like [Dinoponera quadriceps]
MVFLQQVVHSINVLWNDRRGTMTAFTRFATDLYLTTLKISVPIINSFLGTFLFTLAAAVTAWPSFEGHGLHDEPKLISQSVHLHEVPTKIIKVTKTVAIKVPVPYPVKVPHHIPFPVPVKHPVAVPVPQIVKVPQHVPVPVEKPVPVELHQQVPLVVSKPVPIPHPIPVPHPITLTKPVFIPVPKTIPIPQSAHDNVGGGGVSGDDEHVGHETNYGSYTVNVPGHGAVYDQRGDDQAHFQPSQPDYSGH